MVSKRRCNSGIKLGKFRKIQKFPLFLEDILGGIGKKTECEISKLEKRLKGGI